eukprot:6349030-Alexandrium_andersonii.AAC.1
MAEVARVWQYWLRVLWLRMLWLRMPWLRILWLQQCCDNSLGLASRMSPELRPRCAPRVVGVSDL